MKFNAVFSLTALNAVPLGSKRLRVIEIYLDCKRVRIFCVEPAIQHPVFEREVWDECVGALLLTEFFCTLTEMYW